MRWIAPILVGFALVVCTPATSQAAIQYASSVIDFSSEYSSGSWSASQALGAPDTFAYGDYASAWAPLPANGGPQHIAVGFTTPDYVSSVTVRETLGNGFVTQIDVIDLSDVLHTVWTGTDPSLPGTPVDFTVSFATTSFLVKGVKVYTDTEHDQTTWEEIDAIWINEVTAEVPEPATLTIWGLGALGCAVAAYRRRKAA